MSTYKEIRRNIRSTLESVVERTTAIKSTVIGEKYPPDYFPFAQVIPGPDTISPDSSNSDQHMMQYWITVVDEEENVITGLESTIDLAADVYEDLAATHSLNGVVDELFIDRFDPRYVIGENYTLHWVLIQLTCRKQIGR